MGRGRRPAVRRADRDAARDALSRLRRMADLLAAEIAALGLPGGIKVVLPKNFPLMRSGSKSARAARADLNP